MLVERMQHYVFPATTVNAAGSIQEGLNLQTDDDAPFRLSGISIWTNNVGGGNFGGQMALRFKRPDGRLVQRIFTPADALAAGNQYAGTASATGGNPNQALASPLSPNILFPPKSVITIDLKTLAASNTTPSAIVVFSGTKLFRDGEVWAPTYPKKFTARPFLNSLLIPNFTPANGAVLNNLFTVEQDADFVWQGGAYTDYTVGVARPVLFATEAGALTVQAQPGAPGGITVQFVVAGNNTPFSITVIGTAITVNLATDFGGNPVGGTQTIVNNMNANGAVSALVVVVNINNPFAPFQAFPITAIPSGASGAANPCQLVDLGVIVRDKYNKAYSNDYVPAAVLFPFLTAQKPGIPYPEIYIPAREQMVFDLNYLYPGFAPTVPVNVVLGLKGMKVYPQ